MRCTGLPDLVAHASCDMPRGHARETWSENSAVGHHHVRGQSRYELTKESVPRRLPTYCMVSFVF